MRGKRTIRAALCAITLASGVAAVPASAEAAVYPDPVVLVSGFNSDTPFTTPDPFCAGQEGDTWNPAAGVAATLREKGFSVFTAPVSHVGDAPPAPCAGVGSPVPPSSAYLSSGGDDDANGAALADFLAFLRDGYGVESVRLVGHSDGGNWSRSAITQSAAYSGVTIRSLTTLGTPYTGSFVADLAIELNGASCDFANKIEQDLCEAVSVLVGLIMREDGKQAAQQLTHAYMESWNPQQRIAACPVTTIAGTYLDLLLPIRYYSPSDGLVGEASALGLKSFDLDLRPIPPPAIPNLVFGGSFPVVHASSLSFLTPKNLLNQQVISDDVAGIVARAPAGPGCNSAAASASASAGAGVAAKRAKIRLPLRFLEFADRDRRIPRLGPEDALVLTKGIKVRCGERPLRALPLLGSRKLRLLLGGRCGPGEAAWAGRARGRGALVLRSHPKADLVLSVRGRSIRVRARGRGVGDLEVVVIASGKKRRLRLDRSGRALLPKASGDRLLRIRVPGRSGSGPLTASAPIPG